MWTAWSLIGVLVVGGLAYGAWAMHAIAHGTALALLVALVPVAYLAAIALATLAWFAISWLWRSPRPPGARIGAPATVRLVWREFVTVAGSPFRMGVWWWTLRDPAPAPAATPVLLLHGVLCNAGVWRSVLHELRARALGPVYTLSYGPPLASIDTFAEQTAGKIDDILSATGARAVVLVGHSMGGLVARAYVCRYGAAKIARVVTLGTPHRGSVLAWIFFGVSLGQLRPGNAWLGALNAAPASVPITTIWSWHDSMVAPQTSAELPGARSIAVTGVGHNALLREPHVIELLAN